VLLRRGVQPPGETYTAPGWDAPEPDRLGPPLGGLPFHLWLLSADGGEGTWETAERRRAWVREAHEMVAGESVSPFVRVALAADFASPLTLFSTAGLRYINADYTLTLGRLPVCEAIGFESGGQLSDDGVAVGHCTLYDSAGPIGHCAVTALAMRQLG
jgi:hypothetical protein